MLMFYIFQTSGLVVYLTVPTDKSGEHQQASLSHERFMNRKESSDFLVFFVGTAVYPSRKCGINFGA
jgi:hypothetical protein